VEDLVISSLDLCGTPSDDRWQIGKVGNKAAELQSLPRFWTPPFVVITTLAHRRWKEDRYSHETAQPSSLLWLVTEAGLMQHISSLSAGQSESLIVRSSAPAETLPYRGRYESVRCAATCEAVLDAVSIVWQQAEAATQPSGTIKSREIAVIVQAYVRTLAAGHLSNERRVSRRVTDWLCEFEVPIPRKRGTVLRFAAKKSNLPPERADFSCETEQNLEEKLRTLAAITSGSGQRCHYEWVWDGYRLWVVQRDTEPDYRASPHRIRTTIPATDAEPPRLRAFVEEANAAGSWQKIECVRTFRACGLAVARVFLLENSRMLGQLINGMISDDLRADLSWLLHFPIVIRTDVMKSAGQSSLLLPRTDAVMDIDCAMDFMCGTAAEFARNGLKADAFCFIAHRFIHSRSCAFSFSWPGISRVRIDSTWGLPDGLLCYPHDSFEIDAKNPTRIKRHIRCKTEYLDIDNNRTWITRRCGRPWDWRASLEPSELQEIARGSCKISEYLRSPVHTMYFVGVDPSSGHPSCLPWYYTTDAIPKLPGEVSESRFIGKHVVISDERDLLRLEESVGRVASPEKLIIVLKPKAELLRSRDFIARLTKIVSSNSFPVELEGSVLSHIYYLLSSQGVRVKSVDAFEPKLARRRFGKLVRDLIPVLIRSHGETVEVYRLTQGELLPLLKAKAIEEALELYWESHPDNIFEELADLLEVIESIGRLFGRSFQTLRSAAESKREARGGFENGVVLVETKEVPLVGPERAQQTWVSEESEQEIKISRLPVRGLRDPRMRGKSIVIPLIPPDPKSIGRQTVIPLGDGDQLVTITYAEKEVLVSIEGTAKRPSHDRQLPLFSTDPL